MNLLVLIFSAFMFILATLCRVAILDSHSWIDTESLKSFSLGIAAFAVIAFFAAMVVA
jgi:hypothetical protein